MNFKKVLIIGLIVLALVVAYVWFFIYNKPHENVEATKAQFSLPATELVKEFSTNHDNAWTKYNDKVVEISGEVAAIEPNDSISSIIFKPGNNYEVYCQVYPRHNDEAKKLQPGTKITVKGLFVNAEKPDTDFDLSGVLRLKKSSFEVTK